MALIDNKDSATRLARAIASDIALYHDGRIVEGLQNDDLFDRMKSEFEEGRELYRSRVSPILDSGCRFFDRAFIDVIVFNKAHIKTWIW